MELITIYLIRMIFNKNFKFTDTAEIVTEVTIILFTLFYFFLLNCIVMI